MKAFKTSVQALKALDSELYNGITGAMRKATDEQVKVLNEVTKPWANRIIFTRLEYRRRGEISQYVMSEGNQKALDIFWFVDRGTEEHLIFPKRPGGALVFNSVYSARTAPIANPSAGTGKSSPPKVFSAGVLHPGNEARLFIDFSMLSLEVALEELNDELVKRINR